MDIMGHVNGDGEMVGGIKRGVPTSNHDNYGNTACCGCIVVVISIILIIFGGYFLILI